MAFQLGWIDAPPDPRTLRLSPYLTAALPPPPKMADWYGRVKTWPMLANDRVGDCAPTACAHLSQAFTAYASTEDIPVEADVLAAYSAISGYDPTTGANDVGCTSLATLGHWRNTGIGGHKITAYVQLDESDHDEVRTALDLFGGLFVAVGLPRSAQPQTGGTWRPGRGGDGQPGSWGGHAIHVGGYRARSLTAITWGATQKMTWGFWDAYVLEAYAVVAPDWIEAGGQSPSGIDLAALLVDLVTVTTQPSQGGYR